MAGRGRPNKSTDEKRVETLIIRLDGEEKQTFQDAAKISGSPLSSWARAKLRQAAIKELEEVGHPVELFKKIKW